MLLPMTNDQIYDYLETEELGDQISRLNFKSVSNISKENFRLSSYKHSGKSHIKLVSYLDDTYNVLNDWAKFYPNIYNRYTEIDFSKYPIKSNKLDVSINKSNSTGFKINIDSKEYVLFLFAINAHDFCCVPNNWLLKQPTPIICCVMYNGIQYFSEICYLEKQNFGTNIIISSNIVNGMIKLEFVAENFLNQWEETYIYNFSYFDNNLGHISAGTELKKYIYLCPKSLIKKTVKNNSKSMLTGLGHDVDFHFSN